MLKHRMWVGYAFKHPQPILRAKLRKICIYHCTPQFYHIKADVMGFQLHGRVSMMLKSPFQRNIDGWLK